MTLGSTSNFPTNFTTFFRSSTCSSIVSCDCISKYSRVCGDDGNIYWINSCGDKESIVRENDVDSNPSIDFVSLDGNCAADVLICGVEVKNWIDNPLNLQNPNALTCVSSVCEDGAAGTKKYNDGDNWCVGFSTAKGLLQEDNPDYFGFGVGQYRYTCINNGQILIAKALTGRESVCVNGIIKDDDYGSCVKCNEGECSKETCENLDDCKFIDLNKEVKIEGTLGVAGGFKDEIVFGDLPYNCNYENVKIPSIDKYSDIIKDILVCYNNYIYVDGGIVGSSVTFIEKPDLSVEKLSGLLD